MSTIRITRAERAAIREQVGYWLPGMSLGDTVPFDTRNEAMQAIETLRWGVAFYDRVGWDDHDPRRAFVLPVDAMLIEVCVGGARDAKLDRDQYTAARGEIRPYSESDPPTWAYVFATIEEAIKDADRWIAASENEMRMWDSLLERAGAGAVIRMTVDDRAIHEARLGGLHSLSERLGVELGTR